MGFKSRWLLLAITGVALLAANRSSAAAATMTPAPITVTSCIVQQEGPFRAGGIQISYKNTSSVAATKVKFFVHYRGQRNIIVDKGTFSPGVKISHQFMDFNGMV